MLRIAHMSEDVQEKRDTICVDAITILLKSYRRDTAPAVFPVLFRLFFEGFSYTSEFLPVRTMSQPMNSGRAT